LRASQAGDKYSDHWIETVVAIDGDIKFALGTDVDKAMRFPRSLAYVIAQLRSTEQWKLVPVKMLAIELAKLMAASQE
jgi:hypothetical protein